MSRNLTCAAFLVRAGNRDGPPKALPVAKKARSPAVGPAGLLSPKRPFCVSESTVSALPVGSEYSIGEWQQQSIGI